MSGKDLAEMLFDKCEANEVGDGCIELSPYAVERLAAELTRREQEAEVMGMEMALLYVTSDGNPEVAIDRIESLIAEKRKEMGQC